MQYRHRNRYHEEEYGEDNADFSDDDLMLRKKQLPIYQEKGETLQYQETFYYKINCGDVLGLTHCRFYGDLASHIVELHEKPAKPFLSSHFASCYIDFTSMIAAISLLDLPFEPSEHGYKSIGERSMEIKAATNLIILKKEVKETTANILPSLLLAQRHLEQNPIDGEDIEVKQFITRKIYRGQAVVTNISNQSMSINVLTQIPQGSLPVGLSAYQKTFPEKLDSFATAKFEYYFYFPSPGQFVHSSPMVTQNYVVIAKGNQTILNVLEKKTKLSQEDFKDVIANGSPEQILEFLRDKQIEAIPDYSWNYIYWMLKDLKFWSSLVKLLRSQGRFDQRVWEYSLYHKKEANVIKEYFACNSGFKAKIGYWFRSSLVEINPVDVGYRHIHFAPLINPRVHRTLTGTGPSILNVEMRNAYYTQIQIMMQKKTWDPIDKLCLVYYLVLQDRIPEAYRIFCGITQKQLPKSGAIKLQYDYMLAYFDFYVGQPKFENARNIVEHYKDFPVLAWRLKFLDMEQQLREYDGKEVEANINPEIQALMKNKPIENEIWLTAKIENKEIFIEYKKIQEVDLNFYVIDLETMFSREPFLSEAKEDFSFVQPTSIIKVPLNIKEEKHRLPLPKEYMNKNFFIEVRSEGKLLSTLTFYSSSLKVHIYEKYGELQVTDAEGKLQSEVYVKVFARNGDHSKFYKDGYTDIRGRFDYSSLNNSVLQNIDRFSILIMSDTLGSVIRQCNPPTKKVIVGGEKIEAQGRLISYNKQEKKQSKE